MKRETNQVIWKTVVVAGAMLGTPACKPKPAPTTPTNTATPAPATPEASAKPDPAAPSDPADPCNAPDSPNRPRGADDDGGGGVGRGFVLS